MAKVKHELTGKYNICLPMVLGQKMQKIAMTAIDLHRKFFRTTHSPIVNYIYVKIITSPSYVIMDHL